MPKLTNAEFIAAYWRCMTAVERAEYVDNSEHITLTDSDAYTAEGWQVNFGWDAGLLRSTAYGPPHRCMSYECCEMES